MVSAEQHVWDFTLDGGGLGGQIDIYATQNFPTDPVPIGTEFFVFNSLVSSSTSQDVVANGFTAEGCTVLSTQVFPGDNEANFRTERIKLRMDGATCSVARPVALMNDGQTTTLYEHNFVFTVESFTLVEFGSDPENGLAGFWFFVFLWFGLVLVSLMRGWLIVAAWSLINALGLFYESWPISNTTALIGLLMVLVLQAVADGHFGKAITLRVRKILGGDKE